MHRPTDESLIKYQKVGQRDPDLVLVILPIGYSRPAAKRQIFTGRSEFRLAMTDRATIAGMVAYLPNWYHGIAC